MKKLISVILALVLTLSLFPLNVVLGANSPANNPNIETRFQIISRWNGFFNAEIKVKNVSGSVIENWTLSFDFPHEITNIWGAEILSRKNNVYTLKNAGWNINIEAGAEISFGLTATFTDKITEPTNFKIITETSPSLNNDYSIDFQILTDWGSGFSSQTVVTNNSDKPIEAWKLKFDFPHEITNIWGAEIISRENGVYLISNLGYNSIIPPGQSVTIGFNGSPGNISKPTDFILTYNGGGGNYGDGRILLTIQEYAQKTKNL